jgi:hypothetical protein
MSSDLSLTAFLRDLEAFWTSYINVMVIKKNYHCSSNQSLPYVTGVECLGEGTAPLTSKISDKCIKLGPVELRKDHGPQVFYTC